MSDTPEIITFDGYTYLRYDGDPDLLGEGEEPIEMVFIDGVIYIKQK